MDERFLATPIPANVLPGARGVVELGDVIRVQEELASFPIFRHNGRFAEMVTAELAGDFEAPLYGMIAVAAALDKMDWAEGTKPVVSLYGQPEDESDITLLWDGEWEVTYVTFRDMGAAFGVALLGIYILVVAQFGSFRLPLVILTPIPLTFLGIIFGHWLFGAPFSATSMIGFIALAGIIVRNSILLVDFIRHADASRGTVQVLIDAGSIRFKPILLTAVADVVLLRQYRYAAGGTLWKRRRASWTTGSPRRPVRSGSWRRRRGSRRTGWFGSPPSLRRRVSRRARSPLPGHGPGGRSPGSRRARGDRVPPDAAREGRGPGAVGWHCGRKDRLSGARWPRVRRTCGEVESVSDRRRQQSPSGRCQKDRGKRSSPAVTVPGVNTEKW